MTIDKLKKDKIILLLRKAINNYYPNNKFALRWSDDKTSLGDFAGREYTVEVFNIRLNPNSHRKFRSNLRSVINTIEKKLGEHLTFIYHTPEVTKKYYSHLF